MGAFDTSIEIDSPIDTVFGYVSEPLNLSRWNSAVQRVTLTSGSERQPDSAYLMIVSVVPPTEFEIRTTSGPTPFHYLYRFAALPGSPVPSPRASFGVASMRTSPR
jgi:hypothetical protein